MSILDWPQNLILCNLKALGSSEFNQLGIPFKAPYQSYFKFDSDFEDYERVILSPLAIPGPLYNKIISKVACGGMHTVAILGDGTAYSWGCEDNFVLGHNGNGNIPRRINIPCPALQITAGDLHTMAIVVEKGQRSVYFWGGFRNQAGEMGQTIDSPSKVEFKELRYEKVVKIQSGFNHALLMTQNIKTRNGSVFAWGDQTNGKIGRKPAARRAIEKSLEKHKIGLKNVQNIWACGNHSFSESFNTRTNRTQYFAWGYNLDGQLGLGHQQSIITPQKLPFFDDKELVDITGGEFFSIFLDKDGDVYASGINYYGQLGVGQDLKFSSLPIQLNLSNIVRISSGSNFSYAINEQGQVYSWGDGMNYILGNKSEDCVYFPEAQQFEEPVFWIAAGGCHVIMVSPNLDEEASVNRKSSETEESRGSKRRMEL